MGNIKGRILWMSIILLLQSAVSAQIKITASKSDICLRKLTSGGLRSENISYQLTGCTGCNSMEWDVGNGYQVTGSPIFSTAYTTAGKKNVKCKYKTSTGATSVVTLNNAVEVHGIPALDISYTDSVQCNRGDSITISDISTTTVSRQWLIDGIFYQPGPRTMTLSFPPNRSVSVFMQAKNIHGCVNNYLKDSAIIVVDTIKTDITPSQTGGCAPHLIDFDGKIDSGKQSIKSILWTFENSSPTTSTQRSPKDINFLTTDSNDVWLEITSARGCTYNFKKEKLISLGQKINLDISLSATNICASEQVILTNTNSRTNQPWWRVTNIKHVIDSNIRRKLYVHLLDTGTFDVEVFETVDGCTSSTIKKDAITVKGPKALFSSDVNTYCSAPDTLKFTNTTIKAPGTTTWKWNIFETDVSRVGGSDSLNFSYITNKLTKYDVELIATGSNGCADTMYLRQASAGGSLNAFFSSAPLPVCPGQKVSLQDESKNKHPLYHSDYVWTFYNSSGGVIKTSTAAKPTNSYSTVGTYDAKLVIENAKGCKDSVTLKDVIEVKVPEINLSIEDSTICVGDDVLLFADRSKKSNKARSLWEFENIDSIGNTIFRAGDTVSFTTLRPGRWKAKYTLTDTSGGGCTVVQFLPEMVKVSGAHIEAIASPDFGCAPLTTTLSAKVISNWDYDNPTNNPIIWEWVHGNNDTQFVFTDKTRQSTTAKAPLGTHSVKVKFTTGSGCSAESNNAIVYSGVNSAFRFAPGKRCVNSPIKTLNESSSAATSFEYICDSSSVKFLPSKTVREPDVVFTKAGLFNVKLVAHYGTCSDTFSTYLLAEEVIAQALLKPLLFKIPVV